MRPTDEDSRRRPAQRWVVKIGSALLTNDGTGIDRQSISDWVGQIAGLRQQGIEVVLVSSGAVAAGMTALGWRHRPHEIEELQAAAAVGQSRLVGLYESLFQEYSQMSAQILLTHADLADRRRYLNARATLRTLLRHSVLPVVNENDTVVTDEIRFGDNDTLAALVANLIEADRLVILTDQTGVFTRDPRKDPNAELIEQARANDPSLLSVATGGGRLGRGGMVTKIRAARLAARSGAETIIAGGRETRVLARLGSGEPVGTRLIPDTEPVTARKQWLAGQLRAEGWVRLDDGAVRALVTEGKSLLPVGVTATDGHYQRGELVNCLDRNDRLVAKGLINYPVEETRRILRQPSRDIEALLGYISAPELIHRDNLVLLTAGTDDQP